MTEAYYLTRNDARHRAAHLDVQHMDVFVDLSSAQIPDQQMYNVRSVITLESRLPSTFIDIAGTVTAVSINDYPAEFRHQGSQLVIEHLPVGQRCTITVVAECAFSRSGEGLHRYFDPEDGRVYLYTQFEPTDAHRAWPCFDQPDIKPRWTFHVTTPASWVVASNGDLVDDTCDADAGLHTSHFAQTPPLSSYITALVAGDYAVVNAGEWSPNVETRALCPDSEELSIPLRLMCRQALAPYMDSDDILTVTRQGFDYFHQHYRVAYPWGKYDQIFVPEYNLGAMENPGCVTFNERYLSRDTPTFAQRQTRANTILHEMCHMWFGDLATPAWWDDLWLKESFADNQGSMAAAEATQYTEEWAAFAIARKSWAYQQDLYPTTHPIAADIPDVNAAKTNFDGITYAKGAAVLKQLVAWVGKDAFFDAAHEYFTAHAFGATSLKDLLRALSKHAGLDLSTWENVWLHTTGASLLKAECIDSDQGISLRVWQEPWKTLPSTDQHLPYVPRPHQITVGLYRIGGCGLESIADIPVRLEADSVEIPLSSDVVGDIKAHELDAVIPNILDETYAIVALDDLTMRIISHHIASVKDPLPRAVMWSTLWQAVREARLQPSDYVDAALNHAHGEKQDSILVRLLSTVETAVNTFMGSATKDRYRDRVVAESLWALRHEMNEDRRRVWAGILLRTCIGVKELTREISRLLSDVTRGETTLIPKSVELRWLAHRVCAARGVSNEETLEAALNAERTGETEVHYQHARAALPDTRLRAQLWNEVLHGTMSNEHMSAILAGLSDSARSQHEFDRVFFAVVRDYWTTHSIGMGIRFVHGAFPSGVDIGNPERAYHVLEDAQKWLANNEDAPQALHRLMKEHTDDLRRTILIQEAFTD